MKKAIALLLVALMGLSLFGCGKSKQEKEMEKMQKEAEKAYQELMDGIKDATKD